MRLPAGKASPGPSVGQALGPLGINMMEFCKAFNAQTQHVVPETELPVILSAYSNKTFDFVVRTPPTTWFLKKCARINKGARLPGDEVAGYVGLRACYEIAKIKQTEPHMKHLSLEGLTRTVIGSAKSMGVEVYDDLSSQTPSKEPPE